MDDIRAAIAIEQLKKLPSDLDTRTNVRRRYVEQLASVKEIVVPFAHNKEFVSNYIMPVVITKGDVAYRDSVRDKIHAAGVQTSVHYPAVHRFSVYSDYPVVLPQTEYVTDHEITLPMYAALTMDQVDYICSVLDSALR
jgi:dTDP-4-amino-4,6-dideoxygalactose transaminase